jgi:hypothetical protein
LLKISDATGIAPRPALGDCPPQWQKGGGEVGLAVRFYLFSDDGLLRISHRLMEGLARGKDAMPQYAGTKQKVANVLIEMENGKPVRLGRTDGTFLKFDAAGQVHKDLVASGTAAVEMYQAFAARLHDHQRDG